MRRRDFVALMGAAFAGWSSETHAQSTTMPLRLGWVSQNPRSAPFNVAFERRLRELGYIDGQNISLEFIDTRGDVSRIAAAMKEVVERGVDILLAPGPELSLRSAMAATSTRPIVMVAIDYDPISLGYVRSLASPGDQVTGVYFQQTELVGKRLQILKELMPNLTSATVFWDRFSADQWKATEKIAAEANLGLFGIDLGEQPYNYAKSLASVPQAYRGALLVMVSPVVFRDRQRLAEFTLVEKIPNIHALSEFADAGGLISYGANISVLFERAAEYVDRIAKGAKPAELPVEQPTKFELIINLKAAKAIGLTVPPSLLVRSDNVIE
jgi:putative tryptophan/tyrosine transport system substrate-binding protein